VLENEGDLVGIAALREEWVFEGYDLDKEFPWLIVIGVAMDFDEFAAAPSSDTDTRSALEVAGKNNQGAAMRCPIKQLGSRSRIQCQATCRTLGRINNTNTSGD